MHPKQDTSFFITNADPGSGADLGGLTGADAHCTALASAAGRSRSRSASKPNAYVHGTSPDAEFCAEGFQL